MPIANPRLLVIGALLLLVIAASVSVVCVGLLARRRRLLAMRLLEDKARAETLLEEEKKKEAGLELERAEMRIRLIIAEEIARFAEHQEEVGFTYALSQRNRRLRHAISKRLHAEGLPVPGDLDRRLAK
jgi:hypothetical protein